MSDTQTTVIVTAAIATTTLLLAGMAGYIFGQQQASKAKPSFPEGSSLVQAMEALQQKVHRLSQFVEQQGIAKMNGQMTGSVETERSVMFTWDSDQALSQLKQRLRSTLSETELDDVCRKLSALDGTALVDLVEDDAHSLSLADKLMFMGIQGVAATQVNRLLTTMVLGQGKR